MNGFGNQIITIDTSTIEMYPPWTYPLQICYTYVYIYIYIYLFIHYKNLTVLHHRYIFWQPCHRYPSHQNIGETNGTTSHRFTHLCRRHDVMAQVVAVAKSWCQVVVYWIPMDQWIHNQWVCDNWRYTYNIYIYTVITF